MYRVPEEYYLRLHHIRPRFKNDVESVLLFMANEISRIEPSEYETFKTNLNAAIKLYPGNASATDKTVINWRTEISSLFGLIEYDGDKAKPSRMAELLTEKQDLIEFFRYFLYYFQYPGGHLKPHISAEYLSSGVKFKPVRYLLQVMLEGKKQVGQDSKFGITKAEATHLIFNDLRVTRDNRDPSETAKIILDNRLANVEYDSGGDVIRYAGDILDYMELADLVKLRPNYQYYLNTINLETIQAFVNSDQYFSSYDQLSGRKDIQPAEVANTQDAWFAYVNNQLDTSIFEANILSIIEELGEKAEAKEQTAFIFEVLQKIRSRREAEQTLKTKEIGDVGESIVIEHEKIRLTNLDRKELLHLIKKIPEHFAVGYDISSYDGVNNLRRYIEVKTTISRGKLFTNNFHMTPSEWSAADTLGEFYYVYRLLISGEDVTLFLISNPVGKYKEDLIEMVPRDGADIRYKEKSGKWEKLLV